MTTWSELTKNTADDLSAYVRHTMTTADRVQKRLADGDYARALDELDAMLQAWSTLHRQAVRLSMDIAHDGVTR